MSSSTKYLVQSVGADEAVTELSVKGKKATAVEAAKAARKETGGHVRVVTTAGTVVFEQKAKKTIKMTPRYQRVVGLPEGVAAPEGKRVAYVRPRRNGAILHDAESGEYSIMALDSGAELDETFETTRDAGARLKEGVALANA